MAQVVLYPGSFDPVTYGHIDIIKRAQRSFKDVIVGVAANLSKEPIFDTDERVEMLKEATKDIKGIKVESFNGLVIDFAKDKGIGVIIRGLRMISDFEYEFQMALTNRRFSEEVETVFMMPSEKYSFVSSTLLKEAASLGADIASFVPEFVAERLKGRLNA